VTNNLAARGRTLHAEVPSALASKALEQAMVCCGDLAVLVAKDTLHPRSRADLPGRSGFGRVKIVIGRDKNMRCCKRVIPTSLMSKQERNPCSGLILNANSKLSRETAMNAELKLVWLKRVPLAKIVIVALMWGLPSLLAPAPILKLFGVDMPADPFFCAFLARTVRAGCSCTGSPTRTRSRTATLFATP